MTKTEWKPFRGSKETPDQIMLSIKGDPCERMTVRWRACTQVASGFALYRPAGSEEPWRRTDAFVNPFETDLDESCFFFADMTGLSPDTSYEYTVGDDAHRSAAFTFRTAKRNCTRFAFLCLSDTQTGGPEPPADYTEFNRFLKKVLADHPECAFILTAGDNTNCGQTDVQWTGLFEGLRGVAESIPVMFCMGNHDDMGFSDYFTFADKYYSEHATYFTNMLLGSYPKNGPAGWQIPNYSFDYGSAHFAVTGTSGYDEMNAWLLEDAARSDKTWKFAAHHFPVCFSGPEIEIEDTYPTMRDGMEQFDLVFSGHEHSFARSYPRRREGLYDRPSEGTIHYNLGSGGHNPPGTKVVPKVWNAKTYEHEEELSMFTVAQIDGDTCTLTAYVEDGRIVDRCVVDKAADSITPIDRAPRYNRTRLKFKGYDLGIIAGRTPPQLVDGVWYVPVGQIVSFIGGDVLREPGKITVSVYGRRAAFTENSDTVLTDRGEVKMSGPCLRLEEGQLYAPVDDFCRPLRMHAFFYAHNNFLDVESETEEKPIPVQP